MKPWASLILFSMTSTSLLAGEVLTLRYEDLPKLIQTGSREVKAAEILAEASASRQGYQKRARYPRLELESGLKGVREMDGSDDSAPFFKLEGTISLYRGSRDALKDKVQEQETAIRKAEAQLLMTSQLNLAQELFIKLASVRELKKALADALHIVDGQKKSSRVKFNAGLTTSTDLLEFELHEASLKREKRKLEKEEHELSSRLCLLLGIEGEAELALDRAFPHPPEPSEALGKPRPERHPAVKKLGLQADQAQAIAQASVSRWAPELSLFASYAEYLGSEREVPGPLPRRDFATGLRLSIPIGDNLSVQNEALAKGLEASAFALQKQQSEKEIEAKHREYLHEMQVLHELMHESATQLRKAQQYLQQTKHEYERGIKSGPDVLEASRTLYRTQVEGIQLMFDYYLTEVALTSLIGP